MTVRRVDSHSTALSRDQTAGLPRRLLASLYDGIVVLAYTVLLLAAGISVNKATGRIAILQSPIGMDLLSTMTLVVPVVLYFAIQEGPAAQASWGKRKAGIKVIGIRGNRLSFGRSLLRSSVKFLPWELAHVSLIHQFLAPGGPAFWVGAVGSEICVAGYILCLLFADGHRTPYDWMAGSLVIYGRRHE